MIDHQSCMLEVLDTAGQEEYTALRDQWIRDGEGFVLVYSITSRPSFERIRKFDTQIKLVKESAASGSPTGAGYLSSPAFAPSAGSSLPVPVMLVGNKSDKAVERTVSAQEGQQLARDLGYQFVEASAKNCVNVEKAFYDVVRMLRQQRQQHGGGGGGGLHDRRSGNTKDRDATQEYPKSFRPDRPRHRNMLKCVIL